MKLNPLKESDYFYILKNKYTKEQMLYHINGDEIFPIDNKICDDIVEFYKTGCYVKVDMGKPRTKEGSSNRKCYNHLFFDNNGMKLLDLNEIKDKELFESLYPECEGYFEIEIENDGINITFNSIEGNIKMDNRFSYAKMRSFLGIDEDMFFDSVKVYVKS